MKPSYSHRCLKGLEALEPINSQPLHDRIYNEVLIAGQDYTPATAEKHKAGIELLGKILSVCQEFWDNAGEFADPFGAYMEGSFQTSERNGQFFTPKAICDVCTGITVGSEGLDGIPQTFSDGCCGTGRFMLSIAEHYARNNSGAFNFYIVNVDVEFKAFVYCTMNAWLHGIPAVTIWGNSLTMEVFDAFMTFRNLGLPPQCIRVSAAAAEKFLKLPFLSGVKEEKVCTSEVVAAAAGYHGQANLFDFIGSEA